MTSMHDADEDLRKEPSILRCALKKTASVFQKHILYVSYAVVVIAAIVIGYLGITGILIPNLLPVIASVVATLVSIAWYWYALAAIPSVYFGYSLLWCIARELTDEDWQSGVAENIAFALAAIAFAATSATIALAAIAIALAFALAAIAIALAAIVFALAAIAFAATIAGGPTSSWYYVFRFVGAYLHYRKRVKA